MAEILKRIEQYYRVRPFMSPQERKRERRIIGIMLQKRIRSDPRLMMDNSREVWPRGDDPEDAMLTWHERAWN
jgi:hypothetical protein